MIRRMIRLKNDEIKLIKILKKKESFNYYSFGFVKKKKRENQTEN